ncbi:MAG: hypothetical protein K2K48_07520 [Anaeroplasmataceae bacterium]|nr:hypothetical protein [Anaeroplasmataceae bacterium]MDE6415250.1 hypothetical protein [Anaeroplasmataceae bacterium]
MIFHNNQQGSFYLEVKVLKTLDCTDIKYRVDERAGVLPISNQGAYAIYLGHFSFCEVEECENVTFELKAWNPKLETAIRTYRKSLLETIESNVSEIQDVYKNLPKENTERIYHTFKRLLSLAKYGLISKDEALIQEVLKELRINIQAEYSGKKNYVGNWWVFEIGVSRCLNELMILLFEYLSKEEIFYFMAIENFYLPNAEYEYFRRNYPNVNPFKTNYANLADNIYICLLRNLLIQNKEEIMTLHSLVPNLVQITKEGNGFYKDGGFIYHTNIPYTASYGEVLLSSIAKILEVYALLEVDCTKHFEELYILLEKAYMPFLYRQRALDCVRGRSSSRKKGAHYSFNTIMTSFRKLSKLFCKQGFIDYIFNEEMCFDYKPKAYAFNSMNRYVKRNKEYLLAISSYSDRIANFESINNENLLGYYQSNFTLDVYYNEPFTEDEILKINPYYRNGSTNILKPEAANTPMENLISAGVAFDTVLNTCFHQNNTVKGYFSKIVLENSIVAVGTNISSNEDYVSTVYSFDEPYSFHKDAVEASFKLICKQKPIFEKFEEKRSYYDLNLNEDDTPKHFKGTRIYFKNPKKYEYQFYPKIKCIQDEYKLTTLSNAHILEYKNYCFINSFNDSSWKYDRFDIRGRVSMIASLKDDYITIKFASVPNQKLIVNIKGYECVQTDVAMEKDTFIVDDYFEHTLIFRRSL